MMLVSKFLGERLHDNSGDDGITVGRDSSSTIVLEDGNANLARATHFVRRVEERVNTALEDGKDLICHFGEEFEFSRDQTFLRVTGQGFHEHLCIVTGNIVGTVLGREGTYTFRLSVTSRFGDLFLRHMIALSEGFLELERLGAPPNFGESDWLLWFLWKVRLKSAYAAGLPKLYADRTESLPLVRGNLDLNAWLHLPANLGRYPCRFREHSYDNPVTRLVNQTFHYLAKHETRAAELIADMQPIRSAFREACNDQSRDQRREVAGIRNPYFAAYNEVAKLSRLILAREGAAIGTDEDELSALLFDVSLLFEHYVRKLLRNGGLALDPKQSGDYVRHPTGSGPMEMRPDIVLHGRTKSLILDVKYKRWENWRHSRGRQRADLFQVISYAAAHRGRHQDPGRTFGYGLVFPTSNTDQMTIHERFDELGMDFHIFFLRVPPADSRDFGDQIKQHEVRLVEDIRTIADDIDHVSTNA